MSKFVICLALIVSLAIPVSASGITAPEVPDSGTEIMPDDTSSFGDAVWELIRKALSGIRPDLVEAGRICLSAVAAVMMVSILQTFSGTVKSMSELAGAVTIAAVLLLNTNSLISLGTDTVTEMSEYGKLLLPVMTAAMAAQGSVTTSAALYTGTATFNAILTSLLTRLLVPMIYLFLALAAANCAVGEEILKKMRDFLKWLMSWSLKIILTVFTTYMGITGVVSGTTDAVALKATKMTISSMVPVVGGILSDASEAVLVSAGIAKNSAGIYGVLAVLAIFVSPFIRIGVHYLLLKGTTAVCSVFGSKRISELIGDFSTAMGLLLAMTGSVCLLLLISTVCFMKGMG